MLMNIVIGIAFVVAMTFLARTEVSWLNGMIPLFPTFALIGQTSTYFAKGDTATRDVAIIGMPTLIAYGAYLATIALLSEKLGFPRAAVIGVCVWAGCAGIIIYLKKSYMS